MLISFFFFENGTVYAIMWENTECIVVFPLQQRLRERASIFRYTYIANLVNSAKIRKDAVLRFGIGSTGYWWQQSQAREVSYTDVSVISASFANNFCDIVSPADNRDSNTNNSLPIRIPASIAVES
jgi:hypothetical protein